MSDAFEDRLRAHLAATADRAIVDPDPDALMERSVGRPARQGPLAGGAVALAVIVLGAGVLVGVNLGGTGPTAARSAAPPTATLPGRAGASVAPGYSGPSTQPSDGGSMPYTLVFTRTTASGVTIRAYASGGGSSAGCPPAAACPPLGIVPAPAPCPKGAMCAVPSASPPAPSAPPSQTGGSGSTGNGPTTTAPPQPGPGCGQLTVELSTDRAVGSGPVPRPPTAAPTPDTAELLGEGSFGSAEGAPVGWVAVWVGSAVASVTLSTGGAVVDTMAPASGIAVLAVPGSPTLAGATVVGLARSGAAVASLPADQSSGSGLSVCTASPVDPPSTPTTTGPTTTSTVSPTSGLIPAGVPVVPRGG